MSKILVFWSHLLLHHIVWQVGVFLFLHVYLHERVDQPLPVVMCRVRLCKLCDVLMRLGTRDAQQ